MAANTAKWADKEYNICFWLYNLKIPTAVMFQNFLHRRNKREQRHNWKRWHLRIWPHPHRFVDRQKSSRCWFWRAREHSGVGPLLLLWLSSRYVGWSVYQRTRVQYSERDRRDHELGTPLHRRWPHGSSMCQWRY